MSFILDALRKSDQQRHRSVTPTLTSAQIPAESTKQPPLFWYGLLALVLLGAGILIGWMHQWQAEPAAPAAPLSAAKPVEVLAPRLAPAPPPPPPLAEPQRKPEMPSPVREAPPRVAAAPAALPAPAPAPAAVPVTPRETPAKPVVASAPPTPVPPKEAVPAKQEERASAVAHEAAKDSVLIAITELPPALQQELPKLAILAHSYSSKPKARFVFINDRMMHEEEFPVPGLKLEQITPDGMIFSYKGYRFRRSANQ